MSDSVIKGERKASARPPASSSSSSASTRNRKQAGGTRPGKLAKRPPAEKAPARKAAKPIAAKSPAAAKSKKTATKQRSSAAKPAAERSAAKKPSKAAANSARSKSAAPPAPPRPAKAKQSATPPKQSATKPATKQAGKQTRAARPAAPSSKPTDHATPMALVRQPTRDEAAALQAFEKAHKEFARGRFAEAAGQFRSIIERFGVAEVTARARTYLRVAEARLQTEQAAPDTADALYDRGVLELNRANYIGAQELFERALQENEAAPYIHYALAVTRARLGARETAFEALERALELQPTLRARATQDADLVSIRGDAEFERIVFNSRS